MYKGKTNDSTVKQTVYKYIQDKKNVTKIAGIACLWE
jgi:hypothetical protein